MKTLTPDRYMRVKALTPDSFMKRPESLTGVRRVTGSSNVPLNAKGQEQAEELGGRLRGKFTKVFSSPMGRAVDTAREVDPHSTVLHSLGPMRLGAHEGEPVADHHDTINERIINRPSETPEGKGKFSTMPGESTDEFRHRTIALAQNQEEQVAAAPGTKILNLSHGRNMRMLQSWKKAGGNEDRSIDVNEMTRDGDDWSKPGELFKLSANGLDKVNGEPKEDGSYWARHGETNWSNGDNQPAPQATAETRTLPERPETIKAQLDQLRSGVRRVVMVPRGTPAAETPEGMKSIEAKGGSFVYDPAEIKPTEIHQAVADNRLTEILGHKEGGMGVPDKSQLKAPVVAVVAKNGKGVEVHAALADHGSLPTALAQAEKLKPEDGSVHITSPESVLKGRMSLDNWA